MPAADALADLTPGALDVLFAPLLDHSRILCALSGGPDSTALLLLAVRWRQLHPGGPALYAATVDHGLRAASVAEAQGAAAFATGLGVAHRILTWQGAKPATGIQAAAREARYRLLADHASQIGAEALLLGHTRDDQAETVLFRLARGSGPAGLAAMRARSEWHGLVLLRPLLGLDKADLIALLEREGVSYVRDPSNADPRFARPRWRALRPALAAEGLDTACLAQFAARMARVEAALRTQVSQARAACQLSSGETTVFDAARLFAEPEEISLRLVLCALGNHAREGMPALGKAEALVAALRSAHVTQRQASRTLAGALVRLRAGRLSVGPAPKRRKIDMVCGSKSPT